MKKILASTSIALMAFAVVSAASAAPTKHPDQSQIVTDGHQVLGADPDQNIRSSLLREGDAGAGTN